MFDLDLYLSERRRMVELALDAHLPPPHTRPAHLHQAMRYSIFAGGKRLRPILCLAAAEAVGGDGRSALQPAIALEALHTYTLVHDDLPSMDDDALRRGHPTTHIAFGEATAILTGDALLTLAFEWLGSCVAAPPHSPMQFVLELAEAAGSRGVIAGQVEDLAAEQSGDHATDDLLDFIHLHKTAALIRAAARMGGIAGGATAEMLNALSLYGCNLGIAFQIADDILDEIGLEEQLGKPICSDRKNRKLTYVSLYGVDESRRRGEQLIEEAVYALDRLPGPTEPLEALARYTLQRHS